jgi:hypothetical protein
MSVHTAGGRPAAHRRSRAITALMLGVFAIMALAASPAFAKEPTGDFAVFKQCPRFTPGVNFCLHSVTGSGEVTAGKQTVPISSPITLEGGYIRNEQTEEETFVGAINGETLSKSPQTVPGGLAGLVKCNEISNFIVRASCELVFQNGLTGVTATTELAKPAGAIGINSNNLVNGEGVALSLPVKIRLENPLLGSECYVGSSSNPIIWNLTSGTTSPPAPNKPISGKVGVVEFKDNLELIEIVNNTLVDNAWSAPTATGCGGLFAFVLDPLINAKIGLPSAAGHNTAILNNLIKEATAETVIASEK